MTLDIRGSLKNTSISTNPLIVIDELQANCIDAFLIRESNDEGTSPQHVKLDVTAAKSDLLGEEVNVEIVCQDNGCALWLEQLKAFLTKNTSYKDGLYQISSGPCPHVEQRS